ncbi:hypothetical protein FNV43_RR17996 [Rhamnella rubrinervis]|uniref:AP2/ERF domain-containing protein n=1 Tax=Rhamnella rubrinervis TaxID=2594499 RepID=A0A8K0E2U5_9ROSA|nr:hypothetical protein FNV43_RR17996 [Rhamnella rubrinervis]
MVKQSFERPAAERSDSSFKGVRKRKWGKWVSEIRLPNSRERIWLGSYDSAEKAARAFDAALYCLRGSNAKFNFPDNPPEIAGGRSLTPTEIQAAAARFANSNSEPPKNHSDHSMSESHSQMESASPSPSVSEGSGTVQLDSDLTMDGSFSDLFTTMGSGNCVSDFGLFPGFDDLSSDFFTAPPPAFDFGEENADDVMAHDPFLWNF